MPSVAGREPQTAAVSPANPPAAPAPPPERVTLEALTAACAECGAPVTVVPRTQVASCGHCGARLAVHRTASACYTEVIEQIQERVEQAQASIDTLRLRNALAELEMRWKVQRDEMLICRRGGEKSPPTRDDAIGAGGFSLGAFAMGVTAALAHDWPIAVGLLVMLVSGLAQCGKALDTARRFEE